MILMLKPKEMKKIRAIVLKSQVEDLIVALHKAGIVDITKTAYDGLEEGRPLDSFDVISAHLLKLRTAYSLIKDDAEASQVIEIGKAKKIMEKFTLDAELKKLYKEATEKRELVKTLEGQQKTMEKLAGFDFDFSRSETRTLTFKVCETAKITALKSKIEAADPHSSVITSGRIALIIFEKKFLEKVEEILLELGVSELEIPDYVTTPQETINNIEMKKKNIVQKISEIDGRIRNISHESVQEVRDLIATFEIEAERAEITSRFSNSRYAFVLEGWVLADKYPEIEKLVSSYNEAYLENVEIDSHHDVPPTVLDNKGPVNPFEFITKSYSFPKYSEIDPTFTYFIFLSIIYGMIVGDFIYGLISAAVSYAILKKYSHNEILRNVAMIWIVGSIPTMVFGVIYDEWGGLTHYMISEWIQSWSGIVLFAAPLYTGFHRVSELGTLLLISLFVGIAHIGVGLILGVISEWNHSKKHAFAKIGWLMLLSAIILMSLNSLGYIEADMTIPGAALVVLAVIVIGATESIAGLVELPGFAGNILSYLRIGVIGVVGVILAEIINEFIRPQPGMGIVALAIIPIYLGLHVVNCVIAMFEALVQAGRLNIFEYRSKFITGGGKKFSPFTLNKK